MHGKGLVHRGHLKENETTSVWYRYYKGNIWCTQDRRINVLERLGTNFIPENLAYKLRELRAQIRPFLNCYRGRL